MLDFYADWCVSCKEMEHYTFTEPEVQKALGNVVLLQADVTDNDEEDRALLQHFGIFGPPTIAFYSVEGVEQRDLRVVGFQDAEKFARQAADRAVGTLHTPVVNEPKSRTPRLIGAVLIVAAAFGVGFLLYQSGVLAPIDP